MEKFIKNKLEKKSLKFHQGLEMVQETYIFFIMPKYPSHNNMKEENQGL